MADIDILRRIARLKDRLKTVTNPNERKRIEEKIAYYRRRGATEALEAANPEGTAGTSARTRGVGPNVRGSRPPSGTAGASGRTRGRGPNVRGSRPQSGTAGASGTGRGPSQGGAGGPRRRAASGSSGPAGASGTGPGPTQGGAGGPRRARRPARANDGKGSTTRTMASPVPPSKSSGKGPRSTQRMGYKPAKDGKKMSEWQARWLDQRRNQHKRPDMRKSADR